ncbi:reverse transcriptase domain-containing protein [Tanacetum coccineum]
MVTPAEKRDPNKYCEFHADTGHSTDECMQLRKQIDEMIKRALRTPDIRGRRCVLRSFIRTLLRHTPARSKKLDDPSYHITHRIQWRNHLADKPDFPASKYRQNWHKKDLCRTIHDTRNVKIPGKRRNGSTLTEKGRKELCALLKQNLDIFAWKPADMTGVSRHMAEHRLNVREGCPPVRQKKRGQAPERNKAIREEVEKLVDAGIMKEVHYHSRLSNPVMVKKHDGSWRMCVDIKDINKACPQDGYPLPEIDWKVESLCGYPFKCFLDAYKGYHQIKMAEEDEEKTAFITSQGIFCYTKMPFGLKNVGATYQRLVDRAFQKQIGRNLEEGMFLGYKVNAEGLKVCPNKADAVLSLPSPGCLKDVQKLNGKLASLNRFLSKSAEKSLPRGQGSYQRSLNDRKGRQAIASVLCKSCPTRAGGQLHPHGKISISLAQRKQTAEKANDIDKRANIGRFYHGSSCIDGSGAGLILTNPEGVEFTYGMRFRFEATNNEVEYEALIAGLRIAEQMGVKNLQANVDSRLIANQVNGSYVAKESVLRSENKKADALSKIASTSFAHLSKQVLMEELKEKSIHEREVFAIVEEEEQT